MRFRLCILINVICLSCAASVTSVTGGSKVPPTPGKWLRNVTIEYASSGVTGRGIAHLYFPSRYRAEDRARTLLVLHGYRQQPIDWERNTPIAEYADRYGIVLICPAMSTTLYESQYYPETTNRWAPIPGGTYVMDILLPYLRKYYRLADDRGRTGIFGISTGGRGALLLASLHPEAFAAAAGISGDYDPVSMRYDRLLISIYGYYDSHRARWENDDNILRLAPRLKKTALFLAHGGRDNVVPPSQTEALASLLSRLRTEEGEGYECVVERAVSGEAGHDWAYWARLVPAVMKFFDEKLRR